MLGLDNDATSVASKIYGELRRKGALVEDPDLLIASICVAKGLPTVTGNSRHFERFERYGLRIQPLVDSMKAVQGG